MPDLTSLSQKESENNLRSLCLNGNLNIEDQPVTNVSQDKKVVAQNPGKGQPFTKGSTVTLTIGKFGVVTT